MGSVYKAGIALLFLITSAGFGRSQEADGWTRVSNSNISVYTQGGQVRAASVLTTFSTLRSAFEQHGVFSLKEDVPLKVISFSAEKEFQKYQLNSSSCAFYQQTDRTEYVVLQDLSEGHRDVAAHEFTHYLLTHSGVRLPLWMNEGLADFYSTFYVSGDDVTFGRSVSGRLQVLREQAWLPLEDLFGVTTNSPYYSQPERMLLFYSESWALTHMLMVDPRYAGQYPAFLRSINEGRPAVEALQLAFQKTAPQVQQDLKNYIQRRSLPVLSWKMNVHAPDTAFSVARLSQPEMDVVIAGLTPNNAESRADVQRRLVHAANVLTANPEAEESLGYLALREGKLKEARVHFRAAVERNSRDANVWFNLAHLDRETGDVRALLQHAVDLKPDFADARLELALLEAAAGEYQIALESLQRAGKPAGQNAYAAVYLEAFCYAHLGQPAQANAAAQRARQLARDERDRAQVSELVAFVADQTR